MGAEEQRAERLQPGADELERRQPGHRPLRVEAELLRIHAARPGRPGVPRRSLNVTHARQISPPPRHKPARAAANPAEMAPDDDVHSYIVAALAQSARATHS